MSHQLNFLSQIIFHFPEAAQKQGRKFPNPLQTTKKDIVRARKRYSSRSSSAETWKAWPKCFYFKIYHLQLSSKFVWPPFVAHFSPAVAPSVPPPGARLIVIDWNYIFCSPPDISCFISGLKEILSTATTTHTQEVINSKSFLRDFLFAVKNVIHELD